MSELYRDFIEDQFDRVVNAINNELPTPLPADIGKVVQVVSDGGTGAEYALDSVPQELPTPTTSDIGKFATVVSDGSGGAEYSLDSVPQELPTPTTADIGKVATVVSDGSGGAEYSLNTPSSGLPTATGAGHLLGTDNNSNWIELIPTPTGHSVIPYYAGGSWKYKDITPEVTASYYGTLNLSFGALTRAEFVNSNMTKVVAFNGMSADFSKQYTGTIPCYGYQNNKFAVFKGIVFSSGTSGRAEITINIDYSDSTKDSITITDL